MPGLNELPRGERMRIVGWCYLCSFADWRIWAGLILATAFAILCQMLVRFTLPALTTFQLIRKRFPQLCQECGYDLRATVGCCPECGFSSKSVSAEIG